MVSEQQRRGYLASGGASATPRTCLPDTASSRGSSSSDRLGLRGAQQRHGLLPCRRRERDAHRVLDGGKVHLPVDDGEIRGAAAYLSLRPDAACPRSMWSAGARIGERETIAFTGSDGGGSGISLSADPRREARPADSFPPRFRHEDRRDGAARATSRRTSAPARPRRPRDVRRRPARLPGAPPASEWINPSCGTAEFRNRVMNWITGSSSRPRLPGNASGHRPRPARLRRAKFAARSVGITLAAIEPRCRSVFFHGAGVRPVRQPWPKAPIRSSSRRI